MMFVLAPSQEMLLFSMYLGSLQNFLNLLFFYCLQVASNC